MKEKFLDYLNQKYDSGAPRSYIKAMEIIEEAFFTKNFISSTDIWNFINLENIDEIYSFVIEEQKNQNGVFKNLVPESYWKDRYCSAALKAYKEFLVSIIKKQEIRPSLTFPQIAFSINSFNEALNNANITFQKNFLVRFVASLLSKKFVILTGLSGSGKTKLAETFSKWIVEDQSKQICMVAVGADWTNRDPLLGYPNALLSDEYIMPESGVLSLLLEAAKEENQYKPYFLILDEMNLSHVERYFADFLSAMESSSKEIKLHSFANEKGNVLTSGDTLVPQKIQLTPNIFIIGTVNIDETTYMFSPKVLDRAQTIEFRVSKSDMEKYLESPKPIDMEMLIAQGATMQEEFINMAKSLDNEKNNLDFLTDFFDDLYEIGAEFGYRTAFDISSFVSKYSVIDPHAHEDEIIDAAILQKLLPKIHGSRNKIEKNLKALALLCLNEKQDYPFEVKEINDIKYQNAYDKITRMHRRLVTDGFTSFAEA